MITTHAVFHDVAFTWRGKPNKEFHIVILGVKGRCLYTIGGDKNEVLEPGDVLFVPKGMTRFGDAVADRPHEKYTILFEVDDRLNRLPMLTERSAYRKYASLSHAYFKNRFSLLFQQWRMKQPFYAEACAGIAGEMLAAINRELLTQDIPPRKIAVVKKLQAYIMSHFRRTITIEELAHQVDLSPNYVIRLFKEVTGDTPIAFLHQLRMSTARDLLINNRTRIVEVAESLGYCDQSYFNRMYKKQYGVPPSQTIQALHDPPENSS